MLSSYWAWLRTTYTTDRNTGKKPIFVVLQRASWRCDFIYRTNFVILNCTQGNVTLIRIVRPNMRCLRGIFSKAVAPVH